MPVQSLAWSQRRAAWTWKLRGRWQERVVVLTQACDLAQTKTTKVLVALLHPAQSLVERGILKGATIRDQVRRGLVFGWYFLPAAPAPISLPESIIDLHDLHTVPRAVLERLIAEANECAGSCRPIATTWPNILR